MCPPPSRAALMATPPHAGTVPGGSDDPKVHRVSSPLVQRRGRGHRETERVSGRAGEEGLAGEQGGAGGRDKGLIFSLAINSGGHVTFSQSHPSILSHARRSRFLKCTLSC